MNALDPSKLLRLKDVSELTSLGQSTIKLWAADGRFPKPTVLSSTIKVWRHKDVVSWIDQQVELQASIELAAESEQAELRLVSG